MIYTSEEWAGTLFVPLYKEKYIQTVWNTTDPDKQENGWVLKNGMWAPWFFDMRPMGDSPQLFFDGCCAMADMISGHDDVDVLIGIEMAGINLSGGMAVASKIRNYIDRRIGYTRPLPKKVRKPIEAMQLLQSIGSDVAGYGQKDFVEARLRDGDRVAIFDDMATNLGSKVIARQIVLWVAEQKGVAIECNKVFYLLNRGKGNRQAGLDFANESEQGLHPAPLDVNYVIEFDDHLPGLKDVMHPEEFAVISDFQKDTARFQNKPEQKRILELAAKTR